MSRPLFTLGLLLFVASIAMFLAADLLGLRPEPFWIALLILFVPFVGLIMVRYPAALIPSILFVGSFKMIPASSDLDFQDPTFWVLAMLLATIFLHVVLALLGLEEPPLGERIRGQFTGATSYLLFTGVVAFSYLYTRAPEYGFRAMSHFAVIGSLIFFAPLFLIRSEDDIRHAVSSTLLLTIALTVQEFFTRQPETVTDPTRLDAGMHAGVGLLLVLLTPKALRPRVPRPMLLLCIPVLAAGLTISLARGPALSLIIVIVLSLIGSKRQVGLLPRGKMVAILLLLVVPTFLVSFSWLKETASGKLGKKENEVFNLIDLSDPGGTAGQRLALYELAVRGFEQKPVFGWGVGSFSAYAKGTDTRLYPHNLVLLVAMEQGIVGLAALSLFAFAVGSVLKKTISATRGELVLLMWMVLYCLGESMFSGSLDDQRELMLWCGIAFASWRIVRSDALLPYAVSRLSETGLDRTLRYTA